MNGTQQEAVKTRGPVCLSVCIDSMDTQNSSAFSSHKKSLDRQRVHARHDLPTVWSIVFRFVYQINIFAVSATAHSSPTCLAQRFQVIPSFQDHVVFAQSNCTNRLITVMASPLELRLLSLCVECSQQHTDLTPPIVPLCELGQNPSISLVLYGRNKSFS